MPPQARAADLPRVETVTEYVSCSGMDFRHNRTHAFTIAGEGTTGPYAGGITELVGRGAG